MFTVNLSDYTLLIIAAVIITLFFVLQYTLCRRSKKILVRLIPFYHVLIMLIAASAVLVSPNNGSFLDLRGLIAVIIVLFALLCALSSAAAWLIYKLKNKNK